MPFPRDTDSLESRQEQLCQELATIGNFRPGSLVDRHLRCGKPSCRCCDPDDPGHGPYWYLTRTVGGKSVSRKIPPQAVAAILRDTFLVTRGPVLAVSYVV